VRRALLGLLVAAAGCNDFTLVDPPGEQPPNGPVMFVGLRADEAETARYTLDATFFRALDARQRPNEFADRTLGVDGSPLQPIADNAAPEGWWRYESQWTRAEGDGRLDAVFVRPPVSTGPQAPELTFAIPVARRGDPIDVTWSEGADLRLHVSPSSATPPFTGTANSWVLDLADTCGPGSTSRPLAISGSGSFPAELRLPWEWLRSASPAPAVACLRAFSSFKVASAPYPITVVVSYQLPWRLHVNASPP